MKPISRSLLVLLLLAGCGLSGQAQPLPKRGKPNLEPLALEIKKARKGDVAAMLQVAGVCKGYFMDRPEYKDYKKAVQWYNRALENGADAQATFETKFNLCQIYLYGGYGIKPDANLARQYFNEALAIRPDLAKYYEYQPNIFFKDFFTVYDQAQNGDAAANLTYARLLLEYQVNYEVAMDALGRAASLPDAVYLRDKWQAINTHYGTHGHENFDKNQHFAMMQSFQQVGSQIALLEWVNDAATTHLHQQKLSPEKVYQLLHKFPATNPEMQFKALGLLQKHQSGAARMVTLRRLAGVPHGMDATGAAFAKDWLAEFRAFDGQIATVDALGEQLNTKLKDPVVKIEPVAYRDHFGGQVRPFVQTAKEVRAPILRDLAGEARYKEYQQQVEAKIPLVLNRATSPHQLIEWEKAFKSDPWLKAFAPQHQDRLKARYLEFGIDSTNIMYYYEQGLITDTQFKNFDQGKRYVAEMTARLPQPQPVPKRVRPEHKPIIERNQKVVAEQARLVKLAKGKIITDVVGPEPTVEEITWLNKRVIEDPWLQPEGYDKFFEYTSQSKNWFSGQIQRGAILYYYKVMRQTGTDKYKLEIFSVANDESNLVFNAVVKAFGNPADKQFEVHVYNARHTVYQWIPSERDYLKVTYRAGADRIDPLPIGNLTQFQDKGHGLDATRKVNPDEFSEMAAIRSAIQCFILDYNRALRSI
jgi:hypothetical protein